MRQDLLTRRRKRPKRARLNAAYTTSAKSYDGSNDYAPRGAEPTGLADTKEGVFSAWVDFDTSVAQNLLEMSDASRASRFQVQKQANDTIRVLGRFTNGVIILNLTSTVMANLTGFKHIYSAWDLNTATFELLIDGVDVLDTSTSQNFAIDYTAGDCTVGAGFGGATKLDGCLSEMFFHTAFTANKVGEFRDSNGKPKNLGADGTTPLGVPPILYFPNGDPSDNKGTGGNHTIVWGLTDCASSPSD